jgi:hypothetical protein
MLSVGTMTGAVSGRHLARIGCVMALVALLCSGAYAQEIANPSFEVTYEGTPEPRPLPEDWTCVDSPAFSSCCSNFWATDGSLAACLYSLAGADISEGCYQSFYQYVDLTDAGGIVFDAMLQASDGGAFGPFTAALVVTPLDTLIEYTVWSANKAGDYPNQVAPLDPTLITGVCFVELRLTATADCCINGLEFAAFWDNFGFCDLPEPTAIDAAICLWPSVLYKGDPCRRFWWDDFAPWVTCFIELGDGYSATQIVGSTVYLENIPAHMGWQWWARPFANWTNTTDIDWDGNLERMVKFDRADVEAILTAPETTVTVRGLLLDGTAFEGTAVIRVVTKNPWGWPCQPAKPPAWRW